MSEEIKNTAQDEQFNNEQVIENQKEISEQSAEVMFEEEKVETPEKEINEAEGEPAEIIDEEEKSDELPSEENISEELEVIDEEVVVEELKEEKKSIDLDAEELNKMSLKEILQIFEEILERCDQQEMYKMAERIKAAFYVTLKREKIAVGYVAPSSDEEIVIEGEETVSINPFAEVERAFKDLYERYKTLRGAYIYNLERSKEDNLNKKLQIIEDLKNLLEKQEDTNKTFPEFRELQNRWKDAGPVPQARVKDLFETYQHHVELFYDLVKINNELRDLDFKKNFELKTVLCDKAEALENESNVLYAFNQLQILHDEWKEIGPVAREHRESIWDRFRAATTVVNKKHQHFFEDIKVGQKDNLTAKTTLCEEVEEIANREITDSNDWNKYSKEIEVIQKRWKGIGFASKKDNQKIYDRFRVACDKFYEKKREFYSQFKDQMQINLDKKVELCEKAEALKDSTDWKKTTDQLISLQKQWKEIGPVPRKKSDLVWKRFRAACDLFFDNKEKNMGGSDLNFGENLRRKEELIANIKAYVLSENDDTNIEALKKFQEEWNSIGFVPAKEKDRVQQEYKSAIYDKFENYKNQIFDSRGKQKRSVGNRDRDRDRDRSRYSDRDRGPKSERERLVLKYRKKESDIATLENNMGFFAKSKNADAIIAEMQRKLDQEKIELQQLEETIKGFDNKETE